MGIKHWFVSYVVLIIAILTSVLSANADEPIYCNSIPELSTGETAAVQVVKGTQPVHFQASGPNSPDCPGAGDRCNFKSYVLPGDKVLTSEINGDFVCATYMDRKGRGTSGWLPASGLALVAPTPAADPDWTGQWTQAGMDIRISAPAKTGDLAIKGSAVSTSYDQRGKVLDHYTGDFEARVRPDGARMSFAGGDGMKVVNKPSTGANTIDDDKCRVWMQRAGPWLVVDDNDSCGGMNVSFRGIYDLKSSKP